MIKKKCLKKRCARIARRPALGPQFVAFLPIASPSRTEEGCEVSTHFLISSSALEGLKRVPCKDEVKAVEVKSNAASPIRKE